MATSEELAWEVAYLSMASRSPDAQPLFAALDAMMYDGKVSGTGIGRFFSDDQLRLAMRRLCQSYLEGRASERTVRFLAETIEKLHGDPWVYIDFG